MLWGTDSIWYGSPQDQIQAFRTFQIAPELRDKHGYPEMTPALRAKIFGSNALKIYPVAPEIVKKHVRQDKVALQRQEYRERPDPAFVTYGPKTRREFFNLLTGASRVSGTLSLHRRTVYACPHRRPFGSLTTEETQ